MSSTYIWPQIPMGSWRVNANLVLLSTSMACAAVNYVDRQWYPFTRGTSDVCACLMLNRTPGSVPNAHEAQGWSRLRHERAPIRITSNVWLNSGDKYTWINKGLTYLAENLVCPSRVVAEALDGVADVEITVRCL